jgi:hypothetical protein
MSGAAPSRPLRIFLSYGHDANEKLVQRIQSDLERRRHNVWVDRSEIKAGDDWRRQITEGILGSDRVLAFLSKHSTRDPGVCRDEIAIALALKGGNIQTILVEDETDVQPPVNISHVQWLDMHDWQQHQEAGDHWYESKLAEIVRIVESDESRRFAGEIATLAGHLQPLRFDARLHELLRKGFWGRQWLFDSVERWRREPGRSSRMLWIVGEPGVGKSAVAAQLVQTRSDAVIAAHFVEWDKSDHRDGRRIIRSIVFQLATRLPDYRKVLLQLPEIARLDDKDAAELFEYLLANPLGTLIDGNRERFVAVIDALDEAGALQHAFQHANDVSLRMRLDELSRRFGPLIPGVWETGERESFGGHCAKARNAFAHHLPEPQWTEPIKLNRYNDYILQLLGVALMRALGFDDTKIERLMRRGPTVVTE